MKIDYLMSIQNPNGSFGQFHSMSNTSKLTTEMALRRFYFLNLDKEIPIVDKCLDYVIKCLYKEIVIPDRREKVINWDVFEELMFASWLNLFYINDNKVNQIQSIWVDVIEKSFINNEFNIEEYKKQYRSTFGKQGLKEINPASFYMVCLLKNKLSKGASEAFFQYVMKNGIYYICGNNLFDLPNIFDRKYTINYLNAIKLISPYSIQKEELNFVRDWIHKNQSQDGYWHMANLKADGIIFPRSNDWRNKMNKLNDIKAFITEILLVLG